jgi:sugar lactone lactonase YvrE
MRAQAAILIISVSLGSGFGQTKTGNPLVPPVNLPGTSARLPSVKGVAVDAAGDVFFVSGGSIGGFDGGCSVLRWDAVTGMLTSVAGNGTPGFSGDNGPATNAQLNGATDLAVDRAGNLYIADTNNGVVRQVSNGVITTVAGSTFANSSDLTGIAVDSTGSLYIFANGSLLKISNGVISEFGGYEYATDGLSTPGPPAIDSSGNLYFADVYGNSILRLSNGVVTTVAGTGVLGFSGDNGPATSAQLTAPQGVAVDAAGNLYIADTGNQRIRKVSNGVITTVAGGGPASGGLGDNGPATSGLLNFPFGVAVDSTGNLYIEDTLDQRIRKVSKGVITTVAGGGSTAVLLARSAGRFAATGSMSTPRGSQTATLLENGKVLMAGGSATILASELYDPATGTFAATGSMTAVLSGITATLLADGRVLVVGRAAPYDDSTLAGAELYDPATGTFISAGSLLLISRPVTATLLTNGKVLITGNGQDSYDFNDDYVAELYDPSTGTFSVAGNTFWGHFNPTATLLPNGKVLISEGCCAPDGGGAELYDSASGTFSSADGPQYSSEMTATLMTNGKVLIQGGYGGNAEVFDASTETFAAAGDILQRQQSAILLPDGTVLISGGQPCIDTDAGCSITGVANAYLYDPSIGAFGPAGVMTSPRTAHQATLLPDGTALISGGYDVQGHPLASAEIYTPPVLVHAPALFSLSGNGSGQGAIWHADTGKVASPDNPVTAGDVLSMYTTSLAEGGLIPPRVAVGGKLAEVLFFGDAPGYPGYDQVNFRMPSGVAPGTAVPVNLRYIERPSNEVTIGVH